MLFKKVDESNRKPNKTWVDTGSKFYIRSMRSWLQDEIDKYMTSISQNVYIDKFDDIVNKYNNAK